MSASVLLGRIPPTGKYVPKQHPIVFCSPGGIQGLLTLPYEGLLAPSFYFSLPRRLPGTRLSVIFP